MQNDDADDWLQVPGEVARHLNFLKAAAGPNGEGGGPASPVTPAARLYVNAMHGLGGPSPLTASLVAGGLGAAGLYGLSDVYNRVRREDWVIPRISPQAMAVLGGATAASVPAMIWGGSEFLRAARSGGLSAGALALTNPSAESLGLDTRPPVEKSAYQTFTRGVQDRSGDLFGAGADYVPTIEVDQFNRTILSDPQASPRFRALSAGLVSAADNGRGWASPAGVAGVAVGLGARAGAGMLAGRAFSGLMSMDPHQRRQFEAYGGIAGLVSGVAELMPLF